jgi:hypothetical protein
MPAGRAVERHGRYDPADARAGRRAHRGAADRHAAEPGRGGLEQERRESADPLLRADRGRRLPAGRRGVSVRASGRGAAGPLPGR